MVYLNLFISFLKIGAFSFGGGYAALPLIQNEVMNHGWLTMQEFTDLITISQMTPGPIAVNSATFIGTKIGGVLGATIATLGCILPSCIVVTLLAYLYMKYRKLDLLQGTLKMLRPAVVALILTAGISILNTAFFSNGISIQLMIIFMISFFLLQKTKINPIIIMLLSGVMHTVLTLVI